VESSNQSSQRTESIHGLCGHSEIPLALQGLRNALVQEETPAMFDGLQPPQIALWQIIHMATDLQILLGVVDHQFLYGALLGGLVMPQNLLGTHLHYLPDEPSRLGSPGSLGCMMREWLLGKRNTNIMYL